LLTLIGIAPHPPIIIPSIGRGELSKAQRTVDGMKQLSSLFGSVNPALLIVITPHGSVFREGPAVLTDPHLSGDFGQFGFPALKVEFETDPELVDLLKVETKTEQLKPLFLSSSGGEYRLGNNSLDHGAMVPLYYLNEAGIKVPGLHITFGFNPLKDLYRFGIALRRVVEARGLPTAVLASGDLSHRLIPGAPAGYTPRGAEFDQLLVKLLREGRVTEILNMDSSLIEEAGECGLRSFVIALGMVDGEPLNTDIISYEGPFGVGYLVAAVKPEAGKSSLKDVDDMVSTDPAGEMNPAQLARHALQKHFGGGNLAELPAVLPPVFQEKAGAFVSLKKAGALRGCIGTVEAVRKDLAAEIAANAVSAAIRDPRFPPVSAEELSAIDISVDVLSPMEAVAGINELNPKDYGVLVRSGNRSGLLLPDLEGVDSAEEQVAIARRKAGINPTEPADLFRFTVTRYKE
jgi:MEMO1 family protein